MTSGSSPERDTVPSARTRFSLRPIHVAPLLPLSIVALIATSSISDNSFLWHVRAGSVQRESLRVITEDPFSYSVLGTPWRTQSWLIELLYAELERWSTDLSWVNVMVGVLGMAIAALIGISIYRGTRSPIVTAFAMVLVVWLAGPFLQPRPVVGSYVLLAALVLVLQNRDRLAWLAVPILWMWAAVHGSWVIGGGLLVLEWLRTSDRRILRAGFVALIAVSLTAHGIAVWGILVDFFRARGALALMDEWMVPEFADPMQAPYLLVIAAIVAAAVRGKLEMRDLVVVLPFMFFGMTSKRAVLPATIVLIPWAAYAVSRFKVERASIKPLIPGLAMALVAILTFSVFLIRPLGELNQDRFPAPEILTAMRDRNVFHDDVVGGFVIFSEWPEMMTFIDDRAELYGEEFLLRSLEARRGSYEELFAEYGFDAALTKVDWGLTERLDSDGWVRVAEEGPMVLFYEPDR